MLVKTINQFGRHIPSAGGHEGGEVQALGGPPPLFQTVVWAPEEEDRPGLSGVRRPSSASVLLLEKERVADPAPAGSSLGLLSPTRRVCTSAESRERRPGQREKHKYIKQNADET